MSWQKNILDRLGIRKDRSVLVLDKTGVLLHRQFLDYIRKQSFKYSVAHSLMEILYQIKEQEILVIAPFTQTPSFLNKKIDIQILDYQYLPVEIDYSVAKSLNPDQIISLLAYRNQTKEINLISSDNLKQELKKAHQFEKKQQIEDLTYFLRESVQLTESYEDLLRLGKTWGEYVYACFESNICPDLELTADVDRVTEKIVLTGGLKNAFYATANHLKTVDKICEFLEKIGTKSSRNALICFDGMGVSEWILLKNYLTTIGFDFSERYLFALIPTITKISRSAIFYGDCISVYSINTPDEARQFSNHFKNKTCKFFREGDISNDNHLLGIDWTVVIYNFFDEIAHDTKLPPGDHSKFVYFNNILTYLNRSGIKDELSLLKKSGYTIWVCSDHGCVVGRGNGQRIDKYLIEESSKRATLVEKTDLTRFYDVDHYPIPFLKNEKIALLAKNRTLFAYKNYTGISHGGITLEELVVPFAEVIS